MKKAAIISFCIIGFFCRAQTPTLTWAKQFTGNGNSLGKSVTVDVLGNVYTLGYFAQGTVDFDPGAGTFTMSAGANEDIFISKLDAGGNFVWAKQMMGPGQDFGISIAVDALGNVYSTGSFQGIVDFDPGAGTFTLSTAGNEDIFISKLDASGNFVWAKQLGGTQSDRGLGIEIDASGNVYTTGFFNGTADFDPGVGAFNLISTGSDDIFISKLDASGNFVWAKQLGGSAGDNSNAITLDASGNVYTTGYFSGTADFDPSASTYPLTSVAGIDIFVSKLDASGNFVWAKQLGGVATEVANSIAVDASGNVCTTGGFNSTADFDPGAGTFTLSSGGGFNTFVSKLDAAGNFVWAKQIVSSNHTIANGITLDALGYVYTTGYFSGIPDFDPGAGTYTLQGALKDIFISKLDAAGNFIWASQIGGPSNNEDGSGIALDALQNILTTGVFSGTSDFDPSTGTYTLFSIGGQSTYVHKMSQCAVITTSITSQTNVLCFGSSTGAATINVSGGPGFTYTWSPIGGNTSSAINLSANVYSCAVTNSCGNTATQTLAITQPPALTLTAMANNTIMCVGDANTLTANGSGGTGSITYSWVAGPTNSVYAISPTVTTVYTVNITDANNCLKTETISVTVDPCTGIKQTENVGYGALIFPNPFNDSFSIQSLMVGNYQVYNVLGEKVKEEVLKIGINKVDISQQKMGIYYLRIESSLGTKIFKLLKE